jgi:transcriptional regulator GlxA family with amidase domain
MPKPKRTAFRFFSDLAWRARSRAKSIARWIKSSMTASSFDRIPWNSKSACASTTPQITPVLRYIQRQIAAGLRDEQWLEEQCQFLLARLIRSQHRQGKGPNADVDAGSAGKRVEVARRLQRAVDYMHTHLPDEITLADIATVAHLSRFHFLRVFQQAHGRTPMAYLRELRARRALALVASTSLSSAEIALRVGLSRSAMWRRLRHVKGAGARVLRRLDAGSPVGFLASS